MRSQLAAVALVLSAACAGRPGPSAPPPGQTGRVGSPPPTVRVQFVEHGRTVVRTVDLDEYVAAVALGEFAPAAGDEGAVERMLEVQAVVSRTYAAAHPGRHAAEGFDLCSTTHCQIYEPGRLVTSRWAAAARRAAAATAGEILRFDGRAIDALFHADCGGRTSAAADVWGGSGFPYLREQADTGVAAEAHRVWEYTISLDRLQAALVDAGLLPAGAALSGLAVASRDGAGRATAVTLEGSGRPPVRGTALRDACMRAFGARSIQSTRFTLTRSGRAVTFTGTGFGHGVGLCQAGAFARVKAGAGVEDVLAFYYPGTVLAGASRRLTQSSSRLRH